jgi:galactokinase/mevalonate kinase-like predicted kinase
VTLPPAAAAEAGRLSVLAEMGAFVTSDPPDRQLGSGGGTTHALHEAWGAQGGGEPFDRWLMREKRLLIHGSGESRRLPAYGPCGKPLIPIADLHGVAGQHPQQVLLHEQVRMCGNLYRFVPDGFPLMLACGDVLLRNDAPTPMCPQADIVIFGIAASPEEAAGHGVMFSQSAGGTELESFVQKPSAGRIRDLAERFVFHLDTGIWLFGERALRVLMAKCGWDSEAGRFRGAGPEAYDLYGLFGPALGRMPDKADRDISPLSAAVLALPEGRFYHFGTSRSVLASAQEVRNPASNQRSFGHASLEAPPIVMQNARMDGPVSTENRHVWIENAVVPAGWRLGQRHLLTGIPDNRWEWSVPDGVCVDFAPLRDGRTCLRLYGFDDPFRGAIEGASTLWMGRPLAEWFAARDISFAEAGIPTGRDIQDAPLFPVCRTEEIGSALLAWFAAGRPAADPSARRFWLDAERRSAAELLKLTDVARLMAMRDRHWARQLAESDERCWARYCLTVDLSATARLLAGTAGRKDEARGSALTRAHDRMLRAVLASLAGDGSAARHEAAAFGLLREAIVNEAEIAPVTPRRNLLEDQIVWGRSPVRLDLAGGWTDTPPYCLEHGGRVVNVAADLNGQPPIQVFARLSEKPGITLHSIDLGVSETIASYDALTRETELGSGFGIARAALRLCGFDPRFHDGPAFANLEAQLRGELGAGMEISLLAAVPKGSGMGTSSILAATLLGTLSDFLGLRWNADELFSRTLALEQMLTSGGGWQDQVGGLLGGVKLAVSRPGLAQRPVVRWLPDSLLADDPWRRCVLLYYTGLTRVAHNILGEIVKGLFLNSAKHLAVIREIGHNATFASDALQRNDWTGLCEAVRRSWQLNRELDAGTLSPAVGAIVDRVSDGVAAMKLLGAGGGGYLLMLAKDEEAARRVRRELEERPPNAKARFVEATVSRTGLRVTRS